jgi:HlyD family secretion protein
MMKRILPFAISALILSAVVWTILFLYNKSQAVAEVFHTEQPAIRDIVRKTVATGAIEPRQQVEIKPRVSGVIDELFVEAGDIIEPGQKLASIKIIPNMISLNAAESALKSARISYASAKAEYERNKTLFDRGVISETELSRFDLENRLSQQAMQSASSNLQLIKSGAADGGGKVSNVVTSTVGGMVIEVPPKKGTSVTEANNFNPGTTIASVADMNDMIFEGRVDESEVGKLKVGMSLDIVIGAIDSKRFTGELEYIAPKGALVDGAIQFELRAALKLDPEDHIRAGYSANADIVLKDRKQVLSISEALLSFEDKKPYVEVETAPKQFEKRPVSLGLSDGIYVEVLEGVSLKDKLKKPIGVSSDKKRKKGR